MQVAELPRLHRGPLAAGRPEVGVPLALVAVALFVGRRRRRRALRVDAEQELDDLGERVEVEELWDSMHSWLRMSSQYIKLHSKGI